VFDEYVEERRMEGATMAYMAGDEIGGAGPGASLRYIGHSRSQGSEIAVDTNSGELYAIDSLQLLPDRVHPLPPTPGAMSDRRAWIDWAKACFKAAPSLGSDDRITSKSEEDALE
jgi:hypothetical protein